MKLGALNNKTRNRIRIDASTVIRSERGRRVLPASSFFFLPSHLRGSDRCKISNINPETFVRILKWLWAGLMNKSKSRATLRERCSCFIHVSTSKSLAFDVCRAFWRARPLRYCTLNFCPSIIKRCSSTIYGWSVSVCYRFVLDESSAREGIKGKGAKGEGVDIIYSLSDILASEPFATLRMFICDSYTTDIVSGAV